MSMYRWFMFAGFVLLSLLLGIEVWLLLANQSSQYIAVHIVGTIFVAAMWIYTLMILVKYG